MALGSFVGSRLRDARTARGMTASVLAERVGVSPGAISQHELHNMEPRAQTLSRIATVLELPEAHFLRPSLARDPAPLWYRSRASATKRARESAEARHVWLREIVAAIQAHVDLPARTLLDLDTPSDPSAIRMNDIESMANEVRSAWSLGDGPVPNVVSLLEIMGCVVSSFAFGAEDLSAFSQDTAERPYVLLNSDETACTRWRFNAAHELGHLILHRNVPATAGARPEIHKEMERQAHRFASAFLFPSASFAEEVYSIALDALVQVKTRWRVSIQMILRRARDLDMINQDKYERAFRDLSRRGYRTNEPMDETLPIEQPRLIARSIKLMLDANVITRESLMHRLPFSPVDIEVLASLPRGYLSPDWGQVADFNPRQPSHIGSPLAGEARGQLIPFKLKPSS
jgi:Zn-dependent peptidase ImmA (M78 family)/transcriptional regulator with XRE-family HTH domain